MPSGEMEAAGEGLCRLFAERSAAMGREVAAIITAKG